MTSASSTFSADDSSKISPAFAERLAKLGPGEEIRAIVLPVIPPTSKPDETGSRAESRVAAQEAISQTTEAAFNEIDRQLADTDGHRLTLTPNRLGYILIEAPAPSIYALAAQQWVKSIIEDQPIRHLDPDP